MDVLAESILHKLRVLKHVERLFERARQRRVAGLDHLTVGKLERLGRGLGREFQLALDAVQTSRQRDGVDQVRVGHGVGTAQLDARGQRLAGLVDRDADHTRAVAQAPPWRTAARSRHPVVMRLYELTVGLVMALISRACAKMPAM